MAKYLGCDIVCNKIRERLAVGLGKASSDTSESGDRDIISWRQVRDASCEVYVAVT